LTLRKEVDFAMSRLARLVGVALATVGLAASVFGAITETWRKFYDAGSGLDSTADMVVTADGFAYVVGTSELNFNTDIWVAKYNDQGTRVWTKRYDRAGSDDVGIGIVVDSEGNVIVTGTTKDATFNRDITIVKYNSAGTQLWAKHYNGGQDTARAIALDTNNNIYVAGDYEGSPGAIVMLKYLPNGNVDWTRLHSAAGIRDEARDIVVSPQGDVFTCGYSRRLGSQEDMVLISYTTSGITNWVQFFDGPAGGSDIANAVAVDSAGRPIITGSSSGVGTDSDIWTIKRQVNGSALWDVRLDGGVGGGDSGNSVVVDSQDNVIVGGRLYTGSRSDMATIKYDSLGNQLWLKTYSSSGGTELEETRHVTVDQFDNVYSTGSSLALTCIKYSPTGTVVGVMRPSHSVLDRGAACGVASMGRVFVAGTWYISTSNEDVVVLMYTHTTDFTGQLTMQALAGPYPTVIPVDIREAGTQNVILVVNMSVNATGAITMQVPPGDWDLSIRYQNWLRRTMPLLSPGRPSTVNPTLLNGDPTLDNFVDLLDLNAILSQFASSPGVGFVDLDKDGEVGLSDLGACLVNFGQPGDN
jgi:uncharacterized delta-60 repeat protein